MAFQLPFPSGTPFFPFPFKVISISFHTFLVPEQESVHGTLVVLAWSGSQNPEDCCPQVIQILESVPSDLFLHGWEQPKVTWGEVWWVWRVTEQVHLHSVEVIQCEIGNIGWGIVLQENKGPVVPGVLPLLAHCLMESFQGLDVTLTVHCPCILELWIDHSRSIKKHSQHGLGLRSGSPHLHWVGLFWSCPLHVCLLCVWVIAENPTFIHGDYPVKESWVILDEINVPLTHLFPEILLFFHETMRHDFRGKFHHVLVSLQDPPSCVWTYGTMVCNFPDSHSSVLLDLVHDSLDFVWSLDSLWSTTSGCITHTQIWLVLETFCPHPHLSYWQGSTTISCSQVVMDLERSPSQSHPHFHSRTLLKTWHVLGLKGVWFLCVLIADCHDRVTFDSFFDPWEKCSCDGNHHRKMEKDQRSRLVQFASPYGHLFHHNLKKKETCQTNLVYGEPNTAQHTSVEVHVVTDMCTWRHEYAQGRKDTRNTKRKHTATHQVTMGQQKFELWPSFCCAGSLPPWFCTSVLCLWLAVLQYCLSGPHNNLFFVSWSTWSNLKSKVVRFLQAASLHPNTRSLLAVHCVVVDQRLHVRNSLFLVWKGVHVSKVPISLFLWCAVILVVDCFTAWPRREVALDSGSYTTDSTTQPLLSNASQRGRVTQWGFWVRELNCAGKQVVITQKHKTR